MTHAKQHGGWAKAAYSRGETYLACSLCGQRKHPRMQAGPIVAEPQIPVVRLVNILLSMVILWLVIICWGLSLGMQMGVL